MVQIYSCVYQTKKMSLDFQKELERSIGSTNFAQFNKYKKQNVAVSWIFFSNVSIKSKIS